MAGTISLSLSQQFDELGEPLAEGRLYFIRAGTVSTPQNAFYDSALTLPLPNPYTLDAAGRIPFFFLADGSIKIRLIDRHGTTQVEADNVPVYGSSSGEGGGGTVDPTTVWQTGMIAPWYDTGVKSGFVRANGRTIGSATSGATERANADTQALFVFLYAADTNLSVSGGRGVSAAADYAANKTIALPDFRGRVPGGLGAMGNIDALRLTATYFGASGTTLGATGGEESQTIITANLPAFTPSGSVSLSIPVPDVSTGVTTSVSTSVTTSITDPTHTHNTAMPLQGDLGHTGGSPTSKIAQGNNQTGATTLNVTSDAASTGITASSSATSTASSSATSTASWPSTPTGSFSGTAQGGTSTPFDKTQPTILITYYIKL